MEKPFDITKAVDFTDAQIADTWVDLRGNGFLDLVNPQSPMPLILLGGKGSGRTHLMRYCSYSLQKLRSRNRDLIEYIRSQKYLGIYMRCEGLNAGRFEGKGQSLEAWAALFTYYFDLWLGELAILTLRDAFVGRTEFLSAERAISEGIVGLSKLGNV